jgi:hypothetical protein
LRGGSARELLVEDLVDPVARPAEVVEAEERGHCDDRGEQDPSRGRNHGVFGATTHSVQTFALSLPVLSTAATAYR